MGITTHLGIPLQLPIWIIWFASGMTLCSLLFLLLNRRFSRRQKHRMS
jgi:hypothetical protein